MDTLLSLRIFRQVVEGASFARAARHLGISTAMASKHVAHLEKQLGARLLNRTSRRVSLTEAGTVYYEQCREALDMLGAAESALHSTSAQPRGVLKVTAPVWCANAGFAAMLARYRERYPQVIVDLRLSNHKVNLIEDGFDLALRATHQHLPSLIVRPVCRVALLLVAAPAYLARHPVIRTHDDLASHAAVLPAYLDMPQRLNLTGPDGPVSLDVAVAMKSDDSTLVYHSIRAGIGFGYLPQWLVNEDLAQGTLQRLLPDYAPLEVTLYAAYTSRKYLTPKVRTFIDFFSDTYGPGPA